jgi:hypothetical protein
VLRVSGRVFGWFCCVQCAAAGGEAGRDVRG